MGLAPADKGAPGQIFFSEYVGNTMASSDGISLIDDFGNTVMDDCYAHGWYAGPWIRWAVVRRNAFSGVSSLSESVANRTGMPPRCAALVLRAGPFANTTDLVAEHNTFHCPAHAAAGGYDVVGCEHCSVGR